MRPHRQKLSEFAPLFNAAVARSVKRAEVAETPEAIAAMLLEWNTLTKQHVWDLSSVREWHSVVCEANRAGLKVHVGRISAFASKRCLTFPRAPRAGSSKAASSPGRQIQG